MTAPRSTGMPDAVGAGVPRAAPAGIVHRGAGAQRPDAPGSGPAGRLAALASTGPRRAALLLVAFLAVAGLEWLRMPGRAWDQLYAEDGEIFLQQWANDPTVQTLVRPYGGYWHLIPRLAAVVVAALPVSWWAAAASAAACLVVAGVVVLVWVLSRDVLGAWWARVAAALIPLLVPLARMEAIGDLCNLHSYMIYLLIFVLLARPRYRIGANGLMIVAFLAAGTEIQAALLAPLAFVAVRRDRDRIRPFVGWCLGMAAQAWVFVTSDVPRGGGFRDAGSGFLGWALNGAATNAITDSGVLGRLVLRFGWWLPVLALVYFVGCAVLAAVLAPRRSDLRLVAIAVAPLSAASWGASYFVNAHQGMVYADLPTVAQPLMPLTRWGIASAMLLALAVPLLGQALSLARTRAAVGLTTGRALGLTGPAGRLAGPAAPAGPVGSVPAGMARVGIALVVVLLAVMMIWFDRGSTAREQRDWAPDVVAAEQSCATTRDATVRIPIMNWGNWAVVVACARL